MNSYKESSASYIKIMHAEPRVELYFQHADQVMDIEVNKVKIVNKVMYK